MDVSGGVAGDDGDVDRFGGQAEASYAVGEWIEGDNRAVTVLGNGEANSPVAGMDDGFPGQRGTSYTGNMGTGSHT